MNDIKPDPYEQAAKIRAYLQRQGITADGVNVIDDGQGGKICHIDETTWWLIKAELMRLMKI